LSLDRNPIHFDEDFAVGTLFGRRIAHGMLGMALISGALTALMGAGNIWISSSTKFEKPIFINDTLTCTLTVTEITRRGVADINVFIANDRSETIISGSVKSMRFVARG
jgi:3-hydroxybutyryl-CoA dehydratase